MKRQLLLGVFLIFASFFAAAQEVILSNDFGTDEITGPEFGIPGWTNTDVDGDGNLWGPIDDAFGKPGFTGNLAYSMTFTFGGDALVPKNLYASPMVNLADYESVTLKFRIAALGMDEPINLNHEVLVLTEAQWQDYLDEELDLDSVEPFYTSTISTADDTVVKTVDLTSFAGQQVRLVFYHNEASHPGMAILFLDDIEVTGELPVAECALPTGLGSSAVAGNTATISWTASSSAPADGYDYYYSTSNTAPNSGTTPSGSVAAGIVTKNLTGLTPLTPYYVWVRSNCGSGNVSDWTSSITFTTGCGAFSVPTVLQTFETPSTALPSCWTSTSVSGTRPWTTATSATTHIPSANGGTGKMATVISNSSNYSTNLVSPAMDYSAIAGGSPVTRVSVWLYRRTQAGTGTTSIYRMYVHTSATHTGAYLLGTVAMRPNASPIIPSNLNGWYKYTYDIPASYHGQANVYVIVQAASTSSNSSAGVDDMRVSYIPTCGGVTDLEYYSVEPTSATIGWAATIPAPALGYDYYVSQSSTNPTEDTAATGSVGAGITTANLTLLQSKTYYVWVRSKCDNDGNVGPWSSSVTFTTPCAPLEIPTTVEDFEGTAATTEDPFLYYYPDCWTGTTVEGSDPWNIQVPNWHVPAPHSGTRAATMAIYSAGTSLLISPPLAYTEVMQDTRVSVWLYRHVDSHIDDRYKIYVNTDPSLEEATEILDMSSLASQEPVVPVSGWYKYLANIPSSYHGAEKVYVIILGTTPQSWSGSRQLGVEDFSIEFLPTCLPVTDLQSSDITGSGATISWTHSPTTVEQYEYYVSQSNTNPTVGTTPTGFVDGVENTADIILNPAATYYVWVRANCGEDDLSDWSDMITINTPCVPVSLPVVQGFETTQLLPTCWDRTQLTGSRNWEVIAIPPGGLNGIGSNHGGDRIVRMLYGTGNALLHSQAIDYSGVTAATKVDLWLHRHATTPAADLYKVYVNTTKSKTGAVQIFEIAARTTVAPVVSSTGWYNHKMSIPNSFNGEPEVYIIIEAVATTGSSLSHAIDDFRVEECTTAAPTASAGQSFCNSATVAGLTATGTGVKWYTTASGGTALTTVTALVNGTVYYASQTIDGCESLARTAVTVEILVTPAPVLKL